MKKEARQRTLDGGVDNFGRHFGGEVVDGAVGLERWWRRWSVLRVFWQRNFLRAGGEGGVVYPAVVALPHHKRGETSLDGVDCRRTAAGRNRLMRGSIGAAFVLIGSVMEGKGRWWIGDDARR